MKIVIVTKPPSFDEIEDIEKHNECIGMLKKAGIKVIVGLRLCFKAVIIDCEIIYLGSINPLSVITMRYVPVDYMIGFRFESEP